MKLNITSLVLLCLLILTAETCSKITETEKPPIKTSLRLALVDSLVLEYEDEERRLPESIQELCAILISDNKECANTIILEPALYRVDLNKELSLKTNIEKGGSKDISNPKVIGKLIGKNLKELRISKDFTKPYLGKNAGVDISDYVHTKTAKDSILVFSPNESEDKYVLNGKTYNILSDVEEVRNRMLSILCQNGKANFTLLINPPAQTTGVPQRPPVETGKRTIVGPKGNNGKQRSGVAPLRPIGDLTILKGSEGCEICTRYYSAYDATGHVHEIKEKNSTNCCPCNKTVEIRGQTFVMNCDGSPRLQLVE